MGKLFFSSIKMLIRDRQALAWALVFPVVFAVVFGMFDLGAAPEVRIDLLGDRITPVYSVVEQGLGEVETFTVTERADASASARRLDDGDTDVVVTVAAMSGIASVDVLYNEANLDTNGFALTAIERIVDRVNLQAAGVTQPAVVVEARGVAGKDVSYYDFLLPGLVAMGVMNVSIGGMAVAIARFREQRILRRIVATPLRPLRFLSSQVAARLLLALVQAALILGVGVFGFGAELHGNVAWLFVLATIANLIFLNLGFAVAGRAANADAANGLAQAIALPMMFLSGVFFSTDTLPGVIQAVVRFLPLTPLIEAMRLVALDGRSIAAAGPQLAMLGGWVLVSFLAAWRLFRFAEVK